METVDKVKKLRAKRATMALELDAIDSEITRLIQQAVNNENVSPTELSRQLGISRGRIYQILRATS